MTVESTCAMKLAQTIFSPRGAHSIAGFVDGGGGAPPLTFKLQLLADSRFVRRSLFSAPPQEMLRDLLSAFALSELAGTSGACPRYPVEPPASLAGGTATRFRAKSDVCPLARSQGRRLHARARHIAGAAIRPVNSAKKRKCRPLRWCASASHCSLKTTMPSETVGRAMPRFPAFLAIQSRATRMLSSVPALSW